jgi:hypothetical protein
LVSRASAGLALVSVAPAERSRFTVSEIVASGILFRQITYRFLPRQTLRQTHMMVSKFPTSFRYLAGSEINSQRSPPICLMKETHLGLSGLYGVGVALKVRQAERWALEAAGVRQACRKR